MIWVNTILNQIWVIHTKKLLFKPIFKIKHIIGKNIEDEDLHGVGLFPSASLIEIYFINSHCSI